MAKYIACICEGGAERAIMDILLDNHMLIFERGELLDEEVLSCRKGKEFEEKYLGKGFSDKITIYRVLDSRSEEFKLSKAYKEMLIICNEGKFAEFQKFKNNKSGKPSTYCKSELGYKNVKTYEFVYQYFSDISNLKFAIYEYRRLSGGHKKEKTLYDILR